MEKSMTVEFAPLQGYTEAVYRVVHHRVFGGVDCYYSPFVRLEHGEVRRKDLRDIHPENNEGIELIPQIIAKDVAEFDFLLEEVVRLGYRRVDLNLGCSFPMQTKRGRGAALLCDEERFESVMKRINDYNDVDFSIKMRLGMETEEEAMRILPVINDTHLVQVTVHPRLGKDGYKNEVDMDAFGRFAEECRHRLVYNGDLQSVEDVERVSTAFPNVSGVMIGRGLLSRPSLAMEIKEHKQMSADELMNRVKVLHESIFEHYSAVLQGESQLLMKLKTFWEYLEPVIGHKSYKLIKKAVNLAKYECALSQF